MKLTATFWLLILSCSFLTCRKKSEDNLLTSAIVVENSNAAGGINGNKCYIDLYDGKSFTYDQAKLNAAKLDFFYFYTVASPPILYIRNLSDIRFCGSSTGFDTLTTSIIKYASNYGVTSSDFDNLKTSEDIDRLQKSKHIDWVGTEIRVDVSNLNDDTRYCEIFAFVINGGKKGFFKILPYVQQVPATDKAEMTLVIKIQK